ncbi:hypothetical protein FOWG_00277 [Fusarium oxysporum f. sp. lycopersici MN25]|uniref:Uncharacterized protein n=1 Tax=Fusarium oxysporum Fo47 TaxID=660027 RepID=W9KF74_FUSOX|nr:hypothetical protein FOZG_07770 [Fusarium oxysporum Fo47]EWZ99895.1 hypothetical protein FOWG_00277 [Fusarium oxysporum f. sp. lycopersici MN25]KAJ0141042.1 hypothetical protein HZ326_16068 [Fusarium oxysporum f. sp. albedinis]
MDCDIYCHGSVDVSTVTQRSYHENSMANAPLGLGLRRPLSCPLGSKKTWDLYILSDKKIQKFSCSLRPP